MALGAITNQAIDPHTPLAVPVAMGDLKMTVTNVVGDASYPTGGSAITGAQLGLPNGIVLASQTELLSSTGATNAASAAYNIATGKLMAFTNTGVEVTAAVNTSAATWQIIAFGY